MPLKALRPDENMTPGGGSLIYGESCNTQKHCAGHRCPPGQGQGAAAHRRLCELLSGALMSVAPFPKLSAVVYSDCWADNGSHVNVKLGARSDLRSAVEVSTVCWTAAEQSHRHMWGTKL